MNVAHTLGNAGRKVSKVLHHPTIYRSGNMFLNWLGLQSVRMVLKTVQYGLKPTPAYAPKNTLIIANHCGFHSRGEFVGGRRRVTLRMSFRFMDAPRYKLRKLLDPVYQLGRRLK